MIDLPGGTPLFSLCAYSQLSPYGVQWRIQGRAPLFLDQTDARRAENKFFETPFPLPVGLDLPLRTPLQDYVGSCRFSVILP